MLTPSLFSRRVAGFRSGRLWVVASILLIAATTASAQYTKLYDYGEIPYGSGPHSTPISDGTFLYGTTYQGGANNYGVIYKIKPDGSGITNLHDFNGGDGSNPVGDLLYDGTFLYGMTRTGGSFSQGSIFKIKTDGSSFSTIFSFQYVPTGGFPFGSLITDGTSLYGMTSQGGAASFGTVFKIAKDGTGHTKLVEFTGGTDGGEPQGSLFYDSSFLYGMTNTGGTSDSGVIFKVKTDGTGFQKLLDFSNSASGANPIGSLVSDGTFLYGFTLRGGSSNFGVMFKIKPDGTGFVKMIDFGSALVGRAPKGSPVFDGVYFYGMSTDGGLYSNGVFFRVKPDGGELTALGSVLGITDGPLPEGTLFVNGTTLYGVRSAMGDGRYGAIFKMKNDGTNYSEIYTFSIDGRSPVGRPISNGTSYFGLTNQGGATDEGTIYKINADGSGYSIVFNFTSATTGTQPSGSLIYDGTYFYATTAQGGTHNAGTVFKVKPDGTGYQLLADLNYTPTGATPRGSLISDGTFLYGLAQNGGANDYGALFKVQLDGTNFSRIVDFDFPIGANPQGTLIFDGTYLYGLTSIGGANGSGTAFKVKPDGSGYVTLHDFDDPTGSFPHGSLLAVGSTLYGFTSSGGANGSGTVFKVNNDGSGYAVLLDLDGSNSGSNPQGSLISVGGYLYGMTTAGGAFGKGVLFRIKPDGTGYSTYLDFDDGRQPVGSLTTDGTFLYGVTGNGGKQDQGIFFKMSVAPFFKFSSMTPSHGVPGTYVTLKGHNFDPVPSNNVVSFNGANAKVVSGTIDSLIVIVPTSATTGSVSVTAGNTDTSANSFIVDTEAEMFEGKIQNCNFTLVGPNSRDAVLTLIPSTAGGKIRVHFNSFNVSDQLNVYDGPDTKAPLIATEASINTLTDLVATSATGELTFEYIWLDNSAFWNADVTCDGVVATINIDTQPISQSVCVGTTSTFSTAASGTTNITYQWQFSTDGVSAFNDISNGAAYSGVTTAALSVNTTGTFGAGYYRCRVNGDFAPEVSTNAGSLLIKAIPAAPTIVSTPAVCGPASATLTLTGGVNGQYTWYTAATGANAIVGQSNDTYVTPSLSATTIYYATVTSNGCESIRTPVTATVKACNPPVIATTSASTNIGGKTQIDLTSLISDPNNDADLSTLAIIQQPLSGAVAKIVGNVLSIDYTGISFTGEDVVKIQICDQTGLCTIQTFSIEVIGELIVYNAVSPNGDGKNDVFFIEYIDVLGAAQSNEVHIYNRWGDEVFAATDYNNTDRVFKGLNKNGNKLPSGIYFYRVLFNNRPDKLEGWLELKE